VDAGQILQQVKFELQSVTWDDSPGNSVFGGTDSVKITGGVDDRLLNEIRYPAAFVVDQGSDTDPEEPCIRNRRVLVGIMLCQFGDRFGEATMIGSNRSATDGTSVSRGIMEVAERVHKAIGRLEKVDGINRLGFLESDVQPVFVRDMRVVLQKDFVMNIVHEEVTSFPPVCLLSAVGAAGSVTLTWQETGPRYDSFNIHIRRVAGSSSGFPPTSGTFVADVALGTLTYVDAPGAGTFTYGVWGGYDADGDGTRDHFSERDGVDDGRFVTVTA
jgi:hypothetical protein